MQVRKLQRANSCIFEHLNNITFCGNSSLLRKLGTGSGDGWRNERRKVLTEMKKNVFRLTFDVNCSGRSDKFPPREKLY